MEAQSSNSSNRQADRILISGLALLLALPLLYSGYCWGWWGRQSLLLQYLFQCNCPAASEEARYPRSVDVIVSACRNAGARLTPSGRLLQVDEEWNNITSSYLLNFETGEKIPIAIPQDYIDFLTDDLLFVSLNYGGGEEYVLDRTTGKQYPTRRFRSLYPDAMVNGGADLRLLAEALRKAKHVFLINDHNTVVAFTPERPVSAKENFTVDQFDIPGGEPDRVRLFLEEYSVTYQFLPSRFLEEAVSPDGRFIARRDGIYLFDTGEKIAEGYFLKAVLSKQYFLVRGWMYDSSGVIYSTFDEPCLIELGLGIEYRRCYYEVEQPVIKLKVPEDYLSSDRTQ